MAVLRRVSRSATGSACGRSTLTHSCGRLNRHLWRKGGVRLSAVESELTDTELPQKPLASAQANIWPQD
jgi:hypothetical protein